MRTLNLHFVLLLLLAMPLVLSAQTFDDYVAEGDKFYQEFNREKTLEAYQKAEKLDPNNYEILWRISRAYVDIAEHMPTSTDEQEEAQEQTYNLALDYAERTVAEAPDKEVSYVRRAIANGKIALFKGVFSVGDVVEKVRDDCLKSIELGNGTDFEKALAHYVLARTHAKLAEKPGIVRWPLGLGWGDIDIALNEFPKAIELFPNFMMFYFDYAKALIEEDEYDTAREMLNKAIASPITDEDDNKLLEQSKQLLIEIEDE